MTCQICAKREAERKTWSQLRVCGLCFDDLCESVAALAVREAGRAEKPCGR